MHREIAKLQGIAAVQSTQSALGKYKKGRGRGKLYSGKKKKNCNEEEGNSQHCDSST